MITAILTAQSKQWVGYEVIDRKIRHSFPTMKSNASRRHSVVQAVGFTQFPQTPMVFPRGKSGRPLPPTTHLNQRS